LVAQRRDHGLRPATPQSDASGNGSLHQRATAKERVIDATIAGRGFAMIDDMASLKQAMEQMDADDVVVAQAAKDRAAQILADSKLSFSKMAELIEQRRLLLRPKIVTSIKRMDQPAMLGDAAFRDTGASLRREGQSFRQIADALELNAGTVPRYEDTMRKSDLHQMEMESDPDALAWPRAPIVAMHIVLYPLRHPIRFLVIALIAFMLFNTLRGFVGVGRQVSGYVADVSAARQRADAAMSSVSSFFERRIMRRSQEAEAPSTASTPVPSPSPANSPTPATPSAGPAVAAPPTAAPAPAATVPSANESASPAPPPIAPPTPRLDARAAPSSNSAAKGGLRTVQPRTFENMLPEGAPRNSRLAGPCIGGVGGCYWGGGRY
jgi:hypothetical protein